MVPTAARFKSIFEGPSPDSSAGARTSAVTAAEKVISLTSWTSEEVAATALSTDLSSLLRKTGSSESLPLRDTTMACDTMLRSFVTTEGGGSVSFRITLDAGLQMTKPHMCKESRSLPESRRPTPPASRPCKKQHLATRLSSQCCFGAGLSLSLMESTESKDTSKAATFTLNASFLSSFPFPLGAVVDCGEAGFAVFATGSSTTGGGFLEGSSKEGGAGGGGSTKNGGDKGTAVILSDVRTV
mmetsp:Transcript_31251/g.36824  ORF Transcript_31251/g.36824 Transcript_31251/m.36824 type:complete len:242 (-) Transcript_31251:749-1474(-)